MPQNVLGDGTEQQLSQASPPVRSDHHQINFVLMDETAKTLPDLPMPDVVSVGYAFDALRELIEPLPGFGMRIFVNGAHADVVNASGHQHEAGIGEYVYVVQRASKTAANCRGVRQSRFRGGREVGREQNVLHREQGVRPGFAINDCAFGSFNECHETPPHPLLGSRREVVRGMPVVTGICDWDHIGLQPYFAFLRIRWILPKTFIVTLGDASHAACSLSFSSSA